MTDSGHISKAPCESILNLMALDANAPRMWRAEELGAVFQHQMSAPIVVDLGALEPGASNKLRTLAEAEGLLLRSFGDLFAHPRPPVELLRMVKDFAKRNRNHPESAIPEEIATVLYYLSIAAALVRLDLSISTLSDRELQQGMAWAKGQPWVQETAGRLLAQALEKLESKGS